MTETEPRARGRQVPALHTFTFQDTGITVGLRKISPMLRDDVEAMLEKTHPRPTPPTLRVETGPDEWREVENPSDPDYQTTLKAWRRAHIVRLGEELLKLAIARAIEVEVDTEAVAALKADMAALGIELTGDDKYLYVTRICAGSPEDLEELSAAIFNRAAPSREAIEAKKAMFQGAVQGA